MRRGASEGSFASTRPAVRSESRWTTPSRSGSQSHCSIRGCWSSVAGMVVSFVSVLVQGAADVTGLGAAQLAHVLALVLAGVAVRAALAGVGLARLRAAALVAEGLAHGCAPRGRWWIGRERTHRAAAVLHTGGARWAHLLRLGSGKGGSRTCFTLVRAASCSTPSAACRGGSVCGYPTPVQRGRVVWRERSLPPGTPS